MRQAPLVKNIKILSLIILSHLTISIPKPSRPFIFEFRTFSRCIVSTSCTWYSGSTLQAHDRSAHILPSITVFSF